MLLVQLGGGGGRGGGRESIETSGVLLIPNCTRHRMITYTNLY